MAKEKAIQTKVVGRYKGHNVTANKNVNISFVCGYDQLTSYIQLIQFLNIDVDVIAKLPDEKPMKLGIFRVKDVKIDHDGEGVLKFNGMDDFVDTDAINKLVGSELIQIRFKGIVELEDDDYEDDDE